MTVKVTEVASFLFLSNRRVPPPTHTHTYDPNTVLNFITSLPVSAVNSHTKFSKTHFLCINVYYLNIEITSRHLQ